MMDKKQHQILNHIDHENKKRRLILEGGREGEEEVYCAHWDA